MLNLQLSDGAKRAKQIISNFKPLFASKDKYLTYIDSLSSDGEDIKYKDDGSTEVIF